MNTARKFRIACICALIVLAFMISSQASGQGKKSRDSELSPGDRVEVRKGNKWQVGEVVETTRGGLVKVQLS